MLFHPTSMPMREKASGGEEAELDVVRGAVDVSALASVR